jgi:hypothetical protein
MMVQMLTRQLKSNRPAIARAAGVAVMSEVTLASRPD